LTPPQPPASGGAWHRTVDHVSELRLELGGPSWASLLEEAVRALGQQLARGRAPAAPAVTRRVALSAHDREALLVDVLNELIYLAESERWLPVDARAQESAADRVALDVAGVPVEEAPCAVKAATLHGLEVVERDGRWTATVILDT